MKGILALALLIAGSASAQHLAIGIKGGVPLNNNSASDYLIGPTAELRLPLGFSVEADALYRSSTISSWEIPIFAKYHLPTPLLKPYIEAGPSFRTFPNAGGYSSKGFGGGLGLDLSIWKLRAGPELRYTHWGSDPYANQVEFRL